MRVVAGFLGLALGAGLGACVRHIKQSDLDKINVCETTFEQVRELLGKPDVVGQASGKTQWTYWRPRLAVMLLFDDDRVVSDIAINPAGLVEMKSRCGGWFQPQAGSPPAGTPPTGPSPGPAPVGGCDPPCSPGYRCDVGQCLAVCNPPCSPGMRCNQQRVCEPDAQPGGN